MTESSSPHQPVEASSAYAEPRTASGARAGFGSRLIALIVDSVILVVAAGILVGILYAIGDTTGAVIGYLAALVLMVAYYVYLEGGSTGQTIGKRLAKIRVVDANTGGPIGYGRAVGRFFARWLSQIPLYLGYFWMLWDREKQTWHDKLTTSLVVPESAYPVSR